jgi:hypothetical protein
MHICTAAKRHRGVNAADEGLLLMARMVVYILLLLVMGSVHITGAREVWTMEGMQCFRMRARRPPYSLTRSPCSQEVLQGLLATDAQLIVSATNLTM